MYLKYKPTTIFNGRELLTPGHILITTQNGIIEAIVDQKDAGDDIQILDGMLCPGFINAHCHIELSHLKGKMPKHEGLVSFVQQVMSKREASLSMEEKQAAMQLAVAVLNQTGTVAIGDICNTTDSIEIKRNSPVYWHNFIEVSGFVDAVAHKRLAAMQEVTESFKDLESQNQLAMGNSQSATPNPQLAIHNSQFTIQNSLSPHAPYSVSKKLFQLLNEKTAGQLISIHNQEAAAENDLYQNKTGDFLNLYKKFDIQIDSFEPTAETSLQSWLPYFTKGQKIISVHNTFTSEADFYFVQKQSMPLYFCVCINANLYIENTLPPIEMLMKNNGHIILGTDSYASNEHLNMMEEIKTIRQHFPQIPLPKILQWATLNGAMALGIDEQYGSFDKGKKPGLVLIANDGQSSALIQ